MHFYGARGVPIFLDIYFQFDVIDNNFFTQFKDGNEIQDNDEFSWDG